MSQRFIRVAFLASFLLLVCGLALAPHALALCGECSTNADCDDVNPCTRDRCVRAGCTGGARQCTHTPTAGICDDGLACNGNETCDSGVCDPGVPIACDDGVDCTTDACDESIDGCVATPVDSACDDSVFCNGFEACDVLTGCQAGTAIACDDGIDCTTDSCDEASDGCAATPVDAACEDTFYCNGSETCDVLTGCQAGTAIACDDGVGCTIEGCDESIDGCTALPVDSFCDDNVYCNGSETCDAVAGCQAGTAIACDDGIGCTTDSCDEASDGCAATPVDAACEDTFYCNGSETCDVLTGCQAGTAIACDDGVGCTIEGCDESIDGCTALPVDSFCDDNVYCNGSETCDVVAGCQAGTAIACDDGIGCTTDACDEAVDGCAALPVDSACDDSVYCNGSETCDAVAGCQAGTVIACDDGIGCTTDACDEAVDDCAALPVDSFCDDNVYCNGSETCDVAAGCQTGTAIACDDGIGCTTDACDEAVDGCAAITVDSACDDNAYCNGSETCDVVAGCQAGTAIACDDGIGCTTDACDEAVDGCAALPVDSACDDSVYCNGSETCDAVAGCQAGTVIACDDGIGCTTDACDEAVDDCAALPVDSFCDDNVYCNGSETCDVVAGCQTGTAIACDDGIGCTTDACDEASDACAVSVVDTACDDGLFCNGAETCDSAAGCRAGIAMECAPLDEPCRESVCDEVVDACGIVSANEGAVCDDGEACTDDDRCNAGECEGGPLCNEPCERCELGVCNTHCGLPLSTTDEPTTSDALFILQAAVGLRSCEPCLCDVDDSQSITAMDAQVVIRKAIRLDAPLMCPSDAPTGSSTSTMPAETSTTTSTTL